MRNTKQEGDKRNNRQARLSYFINRNQVLALHREFNELARLVTVTKTRLGLGYVRQARENLDQAEGLAKKTQGLFAEILTAAERSESARVQDQLEADDNDEWVRDNPEADEVNW